MECKSESVLLSPPLPFLFFGAVAGLIEKQRKGLLYDDAPGVVRRFGWIHGSTDVILKRTRQSIHSFGRSGRRFA